MWSNDEYNDPEEIDSGLDSGTHRGKYLQLTARTNIFQSTMMNLFMMIPYSQCFAFLALHSFVLCRLVWLVGVLLRGTFQCTAIPKVFNPSLTGWGAGTILGAKCTHQEWIASFMIGWFGSEHYWRYIFGCNGPPFAEPGFSGIPVFITKVRDVRP